MLEVEGLKRLVKITDPLGLVMESLTDVKAMLEQSIPHSPSDPRLVCCCGKNDCAFLQRNRTALEGLENDVRIAAKLGQTLLARHENYVADAEEEHARMTATIGQLEVDKQGLEAENVRTIEENRKLLDQLETLNTEISDSDTHIKSLTATLHSTQEELHRLSILAARTEALEKQLEDFERNHAQLQQTLSSTQEEERTAVQRWRDAERTLTHLQDQIERIEHEATEDRRRHLDVVNRMERRRAVEKELESAAGRLKGAAAVKTMEHEGRSGDVVSSFVKDILSDNANLQMGIVELREMLLNSNEEVENLRDQIMLHQPLEEIAQNGTPTSLHNDLGFDHSRKHSQEVHVHHHYYPPPPPAEPARSRAPAPRKPRKKRSPVTSRSSTPVSTSRSPGEKLLRSKSTTTSATTILAHTSASLPQEPTLANRWSVQSSHAGTSVTSPLSSSPQSTSHRTSSIFERVFSDAAMDSSRPTSPESNDPVSPIYDTSKRRVPSSGSSRSYSAPTGLLPKPTNRAAPFITLETTSEEPSVSNEEYEESPYDQLLPELDEEPTLQILDRSSDARYEGLNSPSEDIFSRPSLRRASSHDSLYSISGMDIHAHQATPRFGAPNQSLRHRPSQLLLDRGTTPLASASLSAAVAARPAMARSGSRIDSEGLHRSLLGDRSISGGSQGSASTLGKKVGGWVFGRWGATPSPSPTSTLSSRVATLSAPATSSRPIPRSRTSNVSEDSFSTLPAPKLPKVRTPGVNQSGPVFGLGPEVKIKDVVVKKMDAQALKETLDESEASNSIPA